MHMCGCIPPSAWWGPQRRRWGWQLRGRAPCGVYVWTRQGACQLSPSQGSQHTQTDGGEWKTCTLFPSLLNNFELLEHVYCFLLFFSYDIVLLCKMNICYVGSINTCLSLMGQSMKRIGPILPCVCVCVCVYLAVKAQENNHNEKKGSPQRRERHHGHSTGVSYKSQTRTWKDHSIDWSNQILDQRIRINGRMSMKLSRVELYILMHIQVCYTTWLTWASPDSATSEIGTFCS